MALGMESSRSDLKVSMAHSDQSEDGGDKKGMSGLTPIQGSLI